MNEPDTEVSRRSILAGAAAVGGLSTVGQATAQESESSSETETSTETTETPSRADRAVDAAESAVDGDGRTETETPGEEQGQETPTYAAQVSPTLLLRDYRVEDQDDGDDRAVLVATVEARTPDLVETADLLGGIESEGVTRIDFQSRNVPKGVTEVRQEATVYEDEAVAVSLASTQGAVTISTGLPTGGSPQAGIWTIGATGVGTMTLATFAAAKSKFKGARSEPEDALQGDRPSGGVLSGRENE